MRLSAKEQKIFIECIKSEDPDAEIYLHGSRVDDSLKGGDIDILIISNQIDFSKKISILSQIKGKLGEQKIDLVIGTKSALESDPFIKVIKKKAVRLK